MGLISGMGTPDTDKVLSVSYCAFSLSLTCAVYLIASYLIWRAPFARAAMLAILVALFRFFMFAPRMHEPYLYCPLVFLIPIASESGFLTFHLRRCKRRSFTSACLSAIAKTVALFGDSLNPRCA